MHPAALDPEQLLKDCEVRFTRRSGPGGQNRNKVETAAILRHRPTGLTAEANERRSQAENRRAALFRLRVALALAHREPAEGGPSPLWQARCSSGRIAINPEHDDFPALLAEALDHLEARGGEVGAASEALDCSGSQLVKLLKKEPRAFELLNALRRRAGLSGLR